MFIPRTPAPRAATLNDAERAVKVLGLGPWFFKAPGTADDVMRLFRAGVRAAHPDAGGDAAAAPERLKELTAARDTLLAWVASQPKADCKRCRGTGVVRGRFSVKLCEECGR